MFLKISTLVGNNTAVSSWRLKAKPAKFQDFSKSSVTMRIGMLRDHLCLFVALICVGDNLARVEVGQLHMQQASGLRWSFHVRRDVSLLWNHLMTGADCSMLQNVILVYLPGIRFTLRFIVFRNFNNLFRNATITATSLSENKHHIKSQADLESTCWNVNYVDSLPIRQRPFRTYNMSLRLYMIITCKLMSIHWNLPLVKCSNLPTSLVN